MMDSCQFTREIIFLNAEKVTVDSGDGEQLFREQRISAAQTTGYLPSFVIFK